MSTFLANLTNEKCSWLILKNIFKEKDLTVKDLKYMVSKNDGWNLFGLKDFFKEPIENIFSKFTMKKTKKYRNVFFIENPPFGKFISFGKCKFKYLINKRIRYLQSNDYKKCRRPKLTMKNFNEYF